MRNRRKLDPWDKRKHPYTYDPDTLHKMLLDDYVSNRPLGGPMEWGAAFVLGACEKIAAHRRVSVDAYFEALLAEGATLTGRTAVPLA